MTQKSVKMLYFHQALTAFGFPSIFSFNSNYQHQSSSCSNITANPNLKTLPFTNLEQIAK